MFSNTIHKMYVCTILHIPTFFNKKKVLETFDFRNDMSTEI